MVSQFLSLLFPFFRSLKKKKACWEIWAQSISSISLIVAPRGNALVLPNEHQRVFSEVHPAQRLLHFRRFEFSEAETWNKASRLVKDRLVPLWLLETHNCHKWSKSLNGLTHACHNYNLQHLIHSDSILSSKCPASTPALSSQESLPSEQRSHSSRHFQLLHNDKLLSRYALILPSQALETCQFLQCSLR